MINLFKNKKKQKDLTQIPKHVAIIMDGNGRWAQKRGLPRTNGHYEGSKALKRLAVYGAQIGMEAMTVYAFSTENWSRPETEVNYLMNLPKKFFDSFMPDIQKNNIRVNFIGDIESLNEDVRSIMNDVVEKTKNNTGMVLVMAINYGSYNEMIRAVKNIATDVLEETITVESINETMFEDYLMTKDLPKIDLLIRTSGEQRLSNFLLWQLAYSEFYFTNVLWPDFNEDELDLAIDYFNGRHRRFGGL